MGVPQNFDITLPAEMAEIVRAKVASGEYASASDLVQAGLNSLFDRDRKIEEWLMDQVGPAYDRLKAHPSNSLSCQSIRDAISAQHIQAKSV